MKKATKFVPFIIALFFLIASVHAVAAERHWVGNGTGNGRFWDRTANWSATQGGAGGAGVPTASDDVFIDGGGNCQINTNAVCRSFSQTVSTGTRDFAQNATLDIGAGGLFLSGGFLVINSSSNTITIAGDWTQTGGTFTADGGSIVFNGTTPQTVTTLTTFNNLTINNPSGVTMNSDITVAGVLTFTSGVLTTANYSLVIGPAGSIVRTSGHVNGNLTKNVPTGAASLSFEIGGPVYYTPVDVAFASVTTPGELTAEVFAGEHYDITNAPVDAAKDVNRYWTFTSSGIVFTTYNATFHFDPANIDAGANANNFIVGQYDVGTWKRPAVGAKTATSTQVTGLSGFSDFVPGEAKIITITASAGANGTISPSGSVVVGYGLDTSFTVSPSTGYHVADVLVDGSSVGAVPSYDFTAVTTDHTIAASFAIDTFTITASAGPNGAISPSGGITVDYGADTSFTITPDTGYHVADVLVDGSSVGAVTSYSFPGVAANHTIAASFAIDTFTIAASAGANGTISPSGSVIVNYGADTSFAITPNAGYHVADVLVDGSSVGAVPSYNFTAVTASHTIAASFAIDTYTITGSAGAHGAISPSGANVVNFGDSLRFDVTPDAGYFIADVKVDTVSVGAVPSYTFQNVNEDHTIDASFAIQTFTITASAGAHGTISPSGGVTVDYGADTSFTITPDAGYHVAGVLVDGSPAGAVTSYSFPNVTASHTIAASFAIDTFTITASAGANGTISPSGSVTVDYGADTSFTITPNAGFFVLDVLVDGSSVGPVTSYPFTNVTANHTIAASFAVNPPHTITATAGAHGTISPAGANIVPFGDSLKFDIAADVGYFIADVKVDTVSVGAVASYTFHNVTANHTIDASFAIQTFKVSALADSGGTISPSGSVVVNYGDDLSFDITPNPGYFVASVHVDTVSVGAVTHYTLTHVTAPHVVHASFGVATYKVTSVAGAGGTISPSGSVVLNYGDSVAYHITPNTGYFISDVHVDSVSVGSVSSYTFEHVSQNHLIQAFFAVQTFKITASAGAGGTISPSGSVVVNYGDSATFSIAPVSGYFIASVHVDTASVGSVSSYTFHNVQANHTISAAFGSSNTLPSAPRLIAPLDAETIYVDIVGTSLDFIWHPSTDPDVQDTVTYALNLKGPSVDTTLTGIPDSIKTWAIVGLLQVGQTYKWTVSASDGHGSVASPDTFSFYADQALGVKEGKEIPKVFALHQNYPNPFNPTTMVKFDLPRAATVTLVVYNILGQEVAKLVNHQAMQPGYQSMVFDASMLPSGAYLYRIYAEEGAGNTFVSVKKMILLK